MKLVDRIRLHAAERPGAVALVWPQGQLSYASLLAQVEDAMRLLAERGVKVLALDLNNGPDWVALDIAAMALGVCLVPLPAFFSPGQVRHAITQSGARAVITDDPGRLRERAGELLQHAESALAFGHQHTRWVPAADAHHASAQPLPDGVDKITFTSGTTGAPKGVMLSWAQMRAVAVSLADAVQLTSLDRHLALMPLAVLLENIGGVYAPLWAGASVSLLPMRQLGMTGAAGVDGRTMRAALAHEQASTAIFTPHTLQAVVESMETEDTALPVLRFAAVGGAPVSARLLRRARQAGLPVFEGYGLSECSSVVCLNTPSANRPGSVGRPLPHVRLGVAEDGEVLIRDSGFIGYLGAAPSAGDIWRTGDLGELDGDGFLYLRGRRRNVFITAFGRNVAPEWVERELTLESAIAQAAVFGEARPFNVGIVVAAAGATDMDVEVALARANRELPDYARVARWIAAETPFSVHNQMLTGSGRVRRETVAAHYRDAIDTLYLEAHTS